MAQKKRPTAEERDERVSVPLDPEEFIAGVLAVDPDADDPDADDEEPED
jgi:hypothetical protein